jgi:hypothetical protein
VTADKLNELAHELNNEVQRLLAEKRALETKCEALRQTELEMTERIGDHQENLRIKMRLEELQRAALKWAESQP